MAGERTGWGVGGVGVGVWTGGSGETRRLGCSSAKAARATARADMTGRQRE